MAIYFEHKDRNVIPNWRSFENTIKLGELNGSPKLEISSSFKPDISDLLIDWEINKSIGMAADLVGVATICNREEDPTILEITKYIIENSDKASQALINTANTIINKEGINNNIELDFSSIDDFKEKSNFQFIYLKINKLKKRLIEDPHNPINWIELGRLYSILGQDNKAKKAVKNALFLAPSNRYILRTAVRFFAHISDFDFAYDFIRSVDVNKNDPWLLATEVSLATAMGRNSRNIKNAIKIIESDNHHPFNISELASSVATVELRNLNIKKSRQFFKRSLIRPNDNALAQAKWACSKKKNLIHFDSSDFLIPNRFEALAIESYQKGQWDEAINFSLQWFLDLPFSKRPIMFGSEIASKNLKNHDLAVDIAKLGLISHPEDSQIINNIAYSLCILNKINEAEKFLNKVPKDTSKISDVSSICLIATKGLLNIRKGNIEEGRYQYLESMQSAKDKGLEYLYDLALINYYREEKQLNQMDISKLTPKIEKIATKYPELTISDEAKELLDS